MSLWFYVAAILYIIGVADKYGDLKRIVKEEAKRDPEFDMFVGDYAWVGEIAAVITCMFWPIICLQDMIYNSEAK